LIKANVIHVRIVVLTSPWKMTLLVDVIKLVKELLLKKKRGFLFSSTVNLTFGPTKTEVFTTGSYDISWVNCAKCDSSLGWKYLSSSNESNASKVGKYCLARYSLTSPQERNEQ